jgi:hypothetical protein
VSGSTIFHSKSPKEAIIKMRNSIKLALSV